MGTNLKVLLIIILLVYLFFILKAVKKKNMRIGYLIFWSITGVILIIALLIPNLIENISKLLQFEIPINMIFSIAIFIILYLVFDLSILLSKESNNNVILTQEISMLKKKVDEIEKNGEGKDGK